MQHNKQGDTASSFLAALHEVSHVVYSCECGNIDNAIAIDDLDKTMKQASECFMQYRRALKE